jgi:hypothetical protein
MILPAHGTGRAAEEYDSTWVPLKEYTESFEVLVWHDHDGTYLVYLGPEYVEYHTY